MATCQYVGNAIGRKQTFTITVNTAANGGTVTATINGKSITYTMTASDTTSTAATAWEALLDDTDAPPEFDEVDWSVSAAVITGEAATIGTPISISVAAAGGAACTLATTIANSSPSDVAIAANWLRNGVAGLPQANDDIVLQDCDVPLLYNLDNFASTRFASFKRYNSHTGVIGLDEWNPNGYFEYRPKYFQFLGPTGSALNMQLGLDDSSGGSGPAVERYNVGAQQTNIFIQNANSVRFLGTNANNTLTMHNGFVESAILPLETTTFASANIDGGSTLTLGPGVTFSGTLTMSQAVLNTQIAPNKIDASNGSTLIISGNSLTFPTIIAASSSSIAWNCNSSITTLKLKTGSTFDKSNNLEAITITHSEMDSDCQISDPYSSISWVNPTTVHGIIGGLFNLLGDRDFHITPTPSGLKLVEQAKIYLGVLPQDLAAVSVSVGTPWISMQNDDHATVLFGKAAASTSVSAQDPVLTLEQALDANGTSAKPLNFTNIWRKQGTLVRDIDSFTKITQGSTNTYDGAGGNSELIWILEIDRTNLDISSGYLYIRASIADTGASSQYGTVWVFLTQPRRS